MSNNLLSGDRDFVRVKRRRRRHHGGGSEELTGGISFAGGYPLDQATGGTITGAYGIGALPASWKTGALFDIVVNGVTTTIHGIGPGYPDVIALAAACGVSATSGIGGGQISKWYDQSGNGNDWVQATATGGLRPQIYLINGKVSLGSSGFLNNAASLSQPFMTNAAAVNNQSLSIFTAITPFSTNNAGAVGQSGIGGVFGTGTMGSPAAADIGLGNVLTAKADFSRAPTAYTGAGDFTNSVQIAISPYIGLQPQILSLVASASGNTVTQNNTTGTGIALVAGTHTANILGGLSNAIYPFSGRMQAFIFSSSIFTGPQITAMKTALAAWAGITLTTNYVNKLNVVVDGASGDANQGSDPTGGYGVIGGGGYGYTEQLKDQLGPGISWHNWAVGGASMANRTVDYTSNLVQSSSFQAGSTKNILIGPGIAQSVSYGNHGNDPAATYTEFLAWLAAAKSVAWTRIAVFVYPDQGDPGIVTYNNLMTSNAIANGVDILDMRGFPNLFVAPNVNTDGHWNVKGTALLTSVVKPYLQQFL